MADLFENPMGLMGFEFVEFASPTPDTLEPFFERLGFTLVAKHRSKDVVLYRQGDINFIVNREPNSPAAYFAAEHGPSACGMAFRVRDSHKAYARALELGAQPIEVATGPTCAMRRTLSMWRGDDVFMRRPFRAVAATRARRQSTRARSRPRAWHEGRSPRRCDRARRAPLRVWRSR